MNPTPGHHRKNDAEPLVAISGREMFNELRGLNNELRTLNGSVAGLAASFERLSKAVADHEKRVRALERRTWPLPSIAAASAVLAVLVAIYSAT